jgi:hypothetical protein
MKNSLDEIERISRMPTRRRDPRVQAQEEEITILLEATMKRGRYFVSRNRKVFCFRALRLVLLIYCTFYFCSFSRREEIQ